MNVNIYNYIGECVFFIDVWKLYVVDCYMLKIIWLCDFFILGDYMIFFYISGMFVVYLVFEVGIDYYLIIR